MYFTLCLVLRCRWIHPLSSFYAPLIILLGPGDAAVKKGPPGRFSNNKMRIEWPMNLQTLLRSYKIWHHLTDTHIMPMVDIGIMSLSGNNPSTLMYKLLWRSKPHLHLFVSFGFFEFPRTQSVNAWMNNESETRECCAEGGPQIAVACQTDDNYGSATSQNSFPCKSMRFYHVRRRTL